MSHPVEIRSEGPEQLDDFVDLLEEAGAWLWDRGIRQWEPGSNRVQRPLLRRYLERGVLLTARTPAASGRLAGGVLVTREPTPEWDARPAPALYLHKLAVARSAAGRGLGRLLLDASAAHARLQEIPLLRLDCWDGNEVLRAYYRDAGFRELEAVPSHGFQVRLFERSLAR